jgi:hypothetical protein
MATDNKVKFTFELDNRSAIRVLKETQGQVERTNRTVRRENEETSASYVRLGESMERTRSHIAGLAGMIGLGALSLSIKDSIQGGMALTSAQVQLQQALKNTGQAADGTFDKLDTLSEALSSKGGFTKQQNLYALGQFVGVTKNAAEAQKLLGLATDISRRRGMDLSSSVSVLARAYTGQVGRLQQLMGPMIAVKTAQYGLTQAHKEEIFALEQKSKLYGRMGPAWLKQRELALGITPQQHALAMLQDKSITGQRAISLAEQIFSGSTAAFSKSPQGQLSNLKAEISNLKDQIGQGLLPIVTKMVHILVPVVHWLDKNRWALYGLAGAVSAYAIALGAWKAAQMALNFKDIIGSAVNKLFGRGGVGDAMKSSITRAGGSGRVTGSLNALAASADRAAAALDRIGGGGAAGAAGAGERTAEKDAATAAKAGRFGRFASLAATAVPFAPVTLAAAAAYLENSYGSPEASAKVKGPTGPIYNPRVAPFVRRFGHPKGYASGGAVGADTVPAWLTPGEGVVNPLGMSMIGSGGLAMINSGRMPTQPIIHHSTHIIKLPNGKELTRVVTQEVLNRGARGPSNLVGGPMVTGATGLTL